MIVIIMMASDNFGGDCRELFRVLFTLLGGETEGNHYSFPSHCEDLA
jgi:hypothetical protein